jgi:hypothetical protein
VGRNVLEVLSFEVHLEGHEPEDFIGSIIQNVEKILARVKPGWSALRQVSYKVSIPCRYLGLSRPQSLLDSYRGRLSVAFNAESLFSLRSS